MAELSIEEALAAEIAELRPENPVSRHDSHVPKHSSTLRERKRKKSKRSQAKLTNQSTPSVSVPDAPVSLKASAKRSKRYSRPHKSEKDLDKGTSTDVSEHPSSPKARTIQVVEFVDPDAAYQIKASNKAPSTPSATNSAVEGPPAMHGGWVDPRQLLQDAAKDITDLNIANTHGKAKRKLERQKVVALGGKAAKEAKMPLPVLQGLRKAQKAKAAKQEELLRAMGMADSKRKLKRTKKTTVGAAGTRWVDRSSITDKRMRGGVLRVKPL
eukprot:m.9578 g.9578  ORF g.9578 m.9578 type:complete len:270 (-) comp9451_c0_seq2:156-965(-)